MLSGTISNPAATCLATESLSHANEVTVNSVVGLVNCFFVILCQANCAQHLCIGIAHISILVGLAANLQKDVYRSISIFSSGLTMPDRFFVETWV